MGTWVDAVVTILLIGLVLIEIKRGFGQAIFDLAAVFIAMRLSYALANPQAGILKLASKSVPLAYGISFVVIAILLILVGHLIYMSTLLNADQFDSFFGGVIGIFVGIIVCHCFVNALNMLAGPDNSANIVQNSVIATEFLDFATWHKILNFLYNFNH